jgi:hypothetical protein
LGCAVELPAVVDEPHADAMTAIAASEPASTWRFSLILDSSLLSRCWCSLLV